MKLDDFFGISERFRLEWGDLSSLLTVVNVLLLISGTPIARIIGLVNCGLSLCLSIKHNAHINEYLTIAATAALNLYFLVSL